MRILVISHMYPFVFNEVNGFFVYQQVKELQRKGCEVKIISPIPWTPFPINHLLKKWKKYSKIPQRATWKGAEIYYPRYISFPKALFFASSGERMYKGIRKTVNKIYKDFKFDLIHSHVALPDGYAGMRVAIQYKKPLIITVHGQDFQQTIYKNKKCRENIEKVINYSKKTVVVSSKLKKIGKEKLKINQKKIIVISNGVNKNDIFKEKSNFVKKYKDKRIVLSVSHLIKIKGIDLNLKAIAKLKKKYKNLIYLIVGAGPEKENLKKLAEDLNIKNNVEFLGEIPHNKVMKYISICDVFSLPSWKEGFGVVYLEAMISGKPVIGCRNQGIDGIIKDKKTGLLVKLKDIDDLVGAIDFLLSNSKRVEKIGKEARRLILENYTWEKIAKKLINLYRSLITK